MSSPEKFERTHPVHGGVEQPLPEDLVALFDDEEALEIIQELQQTSNLDAVPYNHQMKLANDLAMIRVQLDQLADLDQATALRRYHQVADLLFRPDHSATIEDQSHEAVALLRDFDGEGTLAHASQQLHDADPNYSNTVAWMNWLANTLETVTRPITLDAHKELMDGLTNIRLGVEHAKASLGDQFAELAFSDQNLSTYILNAEQTLYLTETLLDHLYHEAQPAADVAAAQRLLTDIQGEKSPETIEDELVEDVIKHCLANVGASVPASSSDPNYYGVATQGGQSNFHSHGLNSRYASDGYFLLGMEPQTRSKYENRVLEKDPLVHEVIAARMFGVMGDISERSDIESDVPAMAITYKYYDRNFSDWAGRPDNELIVNIFLPAELGQTLLETLKVKPILIRRIVENVVKRKIGFGEKGWNAERDLGDVQESRGFSVKPNYSAMHERSGGQEQVLIVEAGKPEIRRPVFLQSE